MQSPSSDQASLSRVAQQDTEDECSPFFVDLSTLPASALDHLRQTGLIIESLRNSSGNEDDANDNLDILLLREKHTQYLESVFLKSLRPSFVSLDAARTWMMYWCLHGLDLMGSDLPVEGDRIVDSIKTCFTSVSIESSSSSISKMGGGFGGGPDQMPHAATTFAAISTLCILAPTHPSALQFLTDIRAPLYVWLESLHDSTTGSFRMQHDGEVDVRATYCVIVVAKLLHLITPQLTQNTVNYVRSCQTYEGGFGGEPGTEAHGGYTYCAVAALRLLGSAPSDNKALVGWLARRQMPMEGGFSGRSNKLVDGCYSFWQGAGLTIATTTAMETAGDSSDDDPWLREDGVSSSTKATRPSSSCMLNAAKLERYVLLCCQDVNGGLRDKPSKGRDFYHSCYCLSGLSMAQHFSADTDHFGHKTLSSVHETHPCYNIRTEHARFILKHFENTSLEK